MSLILHNDDTTVWQNLGKSTFSTASNLKTDHSQLLNYLARTLSHVSFDPRGSLETVLIVFDLRVAGIRDR